MAITLLQLKLLMPSAGGRAEHFLEPLNLTLEEFSINTAVRKAAFLAQICHESGALRYTREISSGREYDKRVDLGNTLPRAISIAKAHGSSPGKWWKGNGLMQISGYTNHLACGKALGLDLLNQPALLELPPGACRSAGWFWQTHHLNHLADSGQFDKITHRINGGTNGRSKRMASYDAAMKLLG